VHVDLGIRAGTLALPCHLSDGRPEGGRAMGARVAVENVVDGVEIEDLQGHGAVQGQREVQKRATDCVDAASRNTTLL
jgi:hypothetical protein